MLKYAEELAVTISQKSPVAVVGSKRALVYSMSHSVEDGLNQVRTMNAGFLQSTDLPTAAMASMSKTKPLFAKL